MYMYTWSKEEAINNKRPNETWESFVGEDYVSLSGWYYKTVAAQEPGEDNILAASYRKKRKDISKSTHLLPFFGTDYGLCSLVKPQITFNDELEKEPFSTLMQDNTKNIKKGINLGKENGLSLLLDAEVYDYAFSPQKGEGYKIA